MTIKDYQDFVNSTNLTKSSNNNFLHLICGLTEEIGEYSGLMKRFYRGDKLDQLGDKALAELGDILWYLTALVSHHGFSLESVIEENIKKLSRRRANNVIRGSGDR